MFGFKAPKDTHPAVNGLCCEKLTVSAIVLQPLCLSYPIVCPKFCIRYPNVSMRYILLLLSDVQKRKENGTFFICGTLSICILFYIL